VEPSNLNRQYYFASQVGSMKTDALKKNIALINPETCVVAHNTRLDPTNIPSLFSGCDIIVEAFDTAEAKQMIVETVQTKMNGTPIIVGSGLAGWGNSEGIKLRKIDETLYVCGDESSDTDAGLPVFAPRVGIVANMQANTVVEILMEL
jgi:sulfur carrier protein ThiS adenylyltransferase